MKAKRPRRPPICSALFDRSEARRITFYRGLHLRRNRLIGATNELFVHHLHLFAERRPDAVERAVGSQRLYPEIARAVVTAELHLGETILDRARLGDRP